MSVAYIYIEHPVTGVVDTLGKLTLKNGSGELTYSPEAQAGRAWVPDPITYPATIQHHVITTNGGVPGFIDDATPDGWGERVLQCMQKDRVTRMDLLMKSPNCDRVGNVMIGRELHPPAGIGQKKLPDLEPKGLGEFIDVCEAISDGQVDDETLRTLRVKEQRSSLGGVRPKRTYSGDGKLILAKPRDRYDEHNLPVVEHACMTFAKTKGMRVANTALHIDDRGTTLLVDRFDRKIVGGQFRRVPMLSALTLFNAEWKATDHSGWMYAKLADELFRRGAPDEDRQELYMRMAFNALAGNEDDHARNHAVIWEQGGWRLSPMYDVLPILGQGPAQALSMSVGVDGPRLSRANLLSQHQHFALTEEEAAGCLDRVAGWAAELKEFYAAFLEGPELDLACESVGASRLLA